MFSGGRICSCMRAHLLGRGDRDVARVEILLVQRLGDHGFDPLELSRWNRRYICC
jgi:hypothetical protein